MTTRISFFALRSVPGKRAKAGVALGLSAAEARRERGQRDRLEVSGDWDEREAGEAGRDNRDDQREAASACRRAAAHRRR